VQQITPNVYVEVFVIGTGCNPSFVVTLEGIVMIDTPSYLPTAAVKWRDEIAKKGEVRYILNTEYHRDHTTGNSFFSGIVVSHQGIREEFGITNNLGSIGTPEDVRQRVKEMDPEGLPLVENYQSRPPTITFTEKLNLYLGNHTFELMHLPGHTSSQVGVYIPQERVIFTGDNVANGWQPFLGDCRPLEWIESLKRIEAMDVDIVVPGHGEVGDKKTVREFRAFIQECIDEVKGAISQGMSKEEAANRISFKDRLPAIHPEPEYQRKNVLHLYEMLPK